MSAVIGYYDDVVFILKFVEDSLYVVYSHRDPSEILFAHPADFVFLYMVETDEKGGHDNGWMSEEYLNVISLAIDNVKRVIEEEGDEYTVIVTADHGGHDRAHGSDMDEDMTIPMIFFGPAFEKGRELHGVSILDIAPTIADIMGITKAKEWEGKSLI